MFGYVTANKPELKMREFGRYKAFYCGLCRRLGKTNGAVSRLTLSYDMTFLILFAILSVRAKGTAGEASLPDSSGEKTVDGLQSDYRLRIGYECAVVLLSFSG